MGVRFTVHNDKYTAVTRGRTVCVLDKGINKEISRFKDLKYAYRMSFNPKRNILAVKSTQPWLAFYCLDTMLLIRKVRINSNQAQDAGFCFSGDGRYFLNIEETAPLSGNNIVIYDCERFEETERLFTEGNYRFKVIERSGNGYLLAGAGSGYVCFIAGFDGKKITEINEIEFGKFSEISSYSEIYYQ